MKNKKQLGKYLVNDKQYAALCIEKHSHRQTILAHRKGVYITPSRERAKWMDAGAYNRGKTGTCKCKGLTQYYAFKMSSLFLNPIGGGFSDGIRAMQIQQGCICIR